ncbi:hypothetical protein AB1K84_01150 [Mesobacillus foraminis]|jgi:hypothetical protein|uniref:Uncharacterized protein n=1 Tax=Mesobacillus foraminis TaxID=279826 RepID=A0A4R2BGF1_9BACI|nr:hypothetical protein [Mesobacillus foraminis]TCN24984.1 hypothetical protein EV146_106186 [Mesobacillus foraminis]
MSLDYTKLMLQTLKQYHKSDITLTFTNEEDVPVLSVSYLSNYFHVKNLNSSVVESYSELYPAVDYIEHSMLLKTLI